MANSSRISELAAIIATNTAKVDSYLLSKGLPPVSFDPDAPVGLLLHEEIVPCRETILEATSELNALILGPIGILTTTSATFLSSLQAIQRFKLASCLPEDQGVATFADIAVSSGLAENQVKRILRYAMTHRIFQEPRKGVVAHTGASKLLAKNPSINNFVGMTINEIWPAASRISDAIVKWGPSEEPNQSAFNIAYNTDLAFFDEISKDPKREERFSAAMNFLNHGIGFEPFHVVNGFAWGALEDGVVVDVGGSHGMVSIALAEKFPALQCIVQDQPDIVKLGESKLPTHLKDRVTFMEHDFFIEQPVKGASVYYIRWILHDWSDIYAIRILRALIPALSPGSKVVINEHVIPEVGSLSQYQERPFRDFDFAMWVLQNGKERDMDDWIKLFKSADERFQLVGWKQPVSSQLGLIEVVWRA